MAGDFRLDGVDVGSRPWQVIFDFAEDGVEKDVGDDVGSCLWQFVSFLQNIEQGIKDYIPDNQ